MEAKVKNNNSLDIDSFAADANIPNSGAAFPTSDYEKVQQLVVDSNHTFWKPTDFSSLNPERVNKALSKLVSEREILRIIRGLYWRGEKDEADNIIQPTAYQVVCEILGLQSGIGYTGITAIRKFGLQPTDEFNEQIRINEAADKVFLAIPYRVPRNVPNTILVNRLGAVKRTEHKLNWLEVSFLEVLHDWKNLKVNKANKEKLNLLVSEFSITPEPSSGQILRIEKLVLASQTEKATVRDSLINILKATDQDDLADKIMPPRSRHSHPGWKA